jgi:sugar/nucleoside kinase (ribokinase family)
VCKVLFVNVKEAALLTKLSPTLAPKTLLVALRHLGAHTVVMTNGAKGAYAANAQQMFFSPPFPAVRKEATGAGDAFSTGVLGALLASKTIADALAWGAVNAASVVEYVGPTAGLLSASAIAKRLRDTPKYRVLEL